MSEETRSNYNDESSEIISNCTTSYTNFRELKRNQVLREDDDEDYEDKEYEDEDEEEEEGYLDLEPADSGSGSMLVIENNNYDREKEKGLEVIIEEDCESSVFSLDFRTWNKDVVYVCVAKHGHKSSLEALSWTLKHWIAPFTTLCLLHVFPLIRLIPSPLGKLPRSHVNKSHINLYLDKYKCNRKLRLQRFIDLCLASQVKVETMLTEGDNIAQSIVDVINNIGLQKLVLGTTKSNLRKSGSRRRKGIASEVVNKAPVNCDVKIICEGKDVIYDIIGDASPPSSDSGTPRSECPQEGHKSRALVPSKMFFGPRIFPSSSR